MTATITRGLDCDATGCNAHFAGLRGQLLPEVRRDARRGYGWSYQPRHPGSGPAGLDLCAEHKPGGAS